MFDSYRERLINLGGSIGESRREQSITIMENTFTDSTAYRRVIMNGNVFDARIQTDSKTTVRGGNGNHLIQFRDDVEVKSGKYVEIPNKEGRFEVWLILYRSDELMFTKHIIKKCNYLMRWKNRHGKIVERWAVFSDNMQLLNGESSMANDKMTLPWYTREVVLPFDEETINIKRDDRFLIDSNLIDGNPDAFSVTNRNIISKTFNHEDLDGASGLVQLGLTQQQFNRLTDNKELMIANYYTDEVVEEPPIDKEKDLTCDILYGKSSDLKMGMPFKTYEAKFYRRGVEVDDVMCDWNINISDDALQNVEYEINGNLLKMKATYNSGLIGSHIRLTISDGDGTCSDELLVKVVSAI